MIAYAYGGDVRVTIDKLLQLITKYARQFILIALLLLFVAVILRQLGVILPIRSIGHVELAYLAGAYWLTK